MSDSTQKVYYLFDMSWPEVKEALPTIKAAIIYRFNLNSTDQMARSSGHCKSEGILHTTPGGEALSQVIVTRRFNSACLSITFIFREL